LEITQLSQRLDKQHNLITLESVLWQKGQRLTRYRFRHYLFRQYLYDALDEAQRVFWHEAVGQIRESFYYQKLPQVAIQLAYHFRGAGNIDKAVHYMLLIGQQAGRLAAAGEAITHLENGLQLLHTLPHTAVRDAQELDFQIALGNALIIAQGYTSPAAGLAYAQARTLSTR
jgi:predicted ATPase